MDSSLGSSPTATGTVMAAWLVDSSVLISACSGFISGTSGLSSLEVCDASINALKFISGGGSTFIAIGGSAGGRGGSGGKGGGVGVDVGSTLTSFVMFAFSSHMMASSMERPTDPLVCSDKEFLRSVPKRVFKFSASK